MFSRVLATLVVVAAASPVCAQAPEERAGTAATEPAPPKDKVVCRKELPIGSKLPVTRCVRKSVADEDKRRGRDFVEDIQTRSRGPWLEKR